MYSSNDYLLESLDPMKKIREDMERAFNPMYDINKSLYSNELINESIAYALEPMKSYSEQIGDMLNPISSVQKQIEDIQKSFGLIDPIKESIAYSFEHERYISDYTKSISNSLYDYEKEMSYILDPMKKINEEMEHMINPMSSIQKEIDELYSFSTPYISQIDALTQSTQTYQEMINSVMGVSTLEKYKYLFEPDILSHETMIATLALSNSTIDDMSSLKFNAIAASIIGKENDYKEMISNTTAIEFDKTNLLQEFNSIKDDIIESLNNKNKQIEETIESIQNHIISQKNPYLLILFQSFILPILAGLMVIAIQPKLNNILNSYENKVVIKKITKSINQSLSSQQIKVKFRIVKADILMVRYKKSITSKILSSLDFGTIVEIVRKEKNWCLIKRYDSESEISIQGWVSTRYLARIR